MSVFETSRHLCLGQDSPRKTTTVPERRKPRAVSHAGKPLLVQYVNTAIKSNKHPEVKNCYQTIKKRRGHKKAIIAIARMLLTTIHNSLKKNEPYNAELYRVADKPPVSAWLRLSRLFLSCKGKGYLVAAAT